jgi:hypothetical protein
MDNVTDNANKNEPKKDTVVAETVEKPKKQKRKFEWTPKRKAAFEKCVAARKNQLQPKKQNKKKEEVLSSSSDSSISSSSSEEYKKPKRKGLKKQFTKLKKDLLYSMKKQLKKRNGVDDDDDDYIFPHYSPPRKPIHIPITEPTQSKPKQEENPISNKPKYCFL